jgi:hypothetical protein
MMSSTLPPARWGPRDKDSLHYDDTSEESDASFFFQQDGAFDEDDEQDIISPSLKTELTKDVADNGHMKETEKISNFHFVAEEKEDTAFMRNHRGAASASSVVLPSDDKTKNKEEEQPSLASASTYSTDKDHGEVKFIMEHMSDASSLSSWNRGVSFDDTEYTSKSGYSGESEVPHSLWAILKLKNVAKGFRKGNDKVMHNDSSREKSQDIYSGFCGFGEQNEPASYTFDENEKKGTGPVEETKSDSPSMGESDEERYPESWSFLGSLSKFSFSFLQPVEEEMIFHYQEARGVEEEKVADEGSISVTVTIAKTTSRVKNLLGNLKRSASTNVQSVKLADSFAIEDKSILVEEAGLSRLVDEPIKPHTSADETGAWSSGGSKRESVLSQFFKNVAAMAVATCAVGSNPDTMTNDDTIQPIADTQADPLEAMTSRTLEAMASQSHNTVFEDTESVTSVPKEENPKCPRTKDSANATSGDADNMSDEAWANFDISFPKITVDTENAPTKGAKTEVPEDNGNVICKAESDDTLVLEVDLNSIVMATTAEESKSTITKDYKRVRATQPMYDDGDVGFEVAFSSLALLCVDPVNVKDCECTTQVYVRKDALPALMDQDEDLVVNYGKNDLKYLAGPSKPAGKLGKAKQKFSKRMLRLRRKLSRHKSRSS